MWVMFSLLFAIIGDAFNDIKEGLGHTPTVLTDLKNMVACSSPRVDRFKTENQTKALVERCGGAFLISCFFRERRCYFRYHVF
jgi:hypothetical protein